MEYENDNINTIVYLVSVRIVLMIVLMIVFMIVLMNDYGSQLKL